MIKFEYVPAVLRVPLDDIRPGFYALIVPDPKEGENFRDFYLLRDGWGVVVYMFGCSVESDDEAAEIAYRDSRYCMDYYTDQCGD